MPKKIRSDCFDVVNKNGQPVLFRTDDVLMNKLSFSLINLTGEALALKGGEPVRLVKGVQASAAGGSSFNFSFESMLTADVVSKLTVTVPDGWKPIFFKETGAEKPASWSVAPVADVVMPKGSAVKIEIGNIKCSSTKPGNFEVMYSNVPGYPDLILPVAKHLNVLNPPDPEKKNLPLEYGYINPIHPVQGQTLPEHEIDLIQLHNVTGAEAIPIYLTYDPQALVENGFTFFLNNTSDFPLVTVASASDFYEQADPEPPQLYLSFLFGEDDYTVTTQQLADNNIRIDVGGKSPWLPQAHAAGSDYWEFRPQNKQIINAHETVYFPVKKIITPLDPTFSTADNLSIMYIQVNNIPGYNDAAYTVALQKMKSEAEMKKFEVSSKDIIIGENIVLNWKSSLAKRVTIDYKTRDNETIMLDSAKGDIKLDGADFSLRVPPSAQSTRITATAYGNDGSSSIEKTIDVKQLPANIRSFGSDHHFVDFGQTPDLVFSWDVTNAQTLVLTTPGGDISVKGQSGYTYKGIQGPFTFTLTASSYYHLTPEVVKSRVMVCTYKAEAPVALPAPAQEIQPLPAIAIDNDRGQVYLVNAADKTVYNINANTLQIGKTYPGNVQALSKNGQKLFVFMPDKKPGSSSIYMYDTVSGARSPRYVLYSQVPGPYPGIVLQVLPNLTRLYWSMVFDFRTFQRSNLQCYEVDAAANRMKLILPANPAFDQTVRAAAFNSDFTKVYTARWTELDITDIATNQERKTLILSGSGPFMFACKKTGNKLYLACENGAHINVIDTANDHITKGITLTNKPVNIVISPDDRFLYAAIYDSSEIAVIDTATDDIVTTLTVGKSPYGMAFESSGDLLFVANYCSKTISFIDAKSNKVAPFTLPAGADKGNPIDVGVCEDKDGTIKVFVAKEWYERRVACPGDTKNTGLDVSVFTIRKPKNT